MNKKIYISAKYCTYTHKDENIVIFVLPDTEMEYNPIQKRYETYQIKGKLFYLSDDMRNLYYWCWGDICYLKVYNISSKKPKPKKYSELISMKKRTNNLIEKLKQEYNDYKIKILERK